MCYYELYVPGTIIDVDISSSLCCMFWTTDYMFGTIMLVDISSSLEWGGMLHYVVWTWSLTPAAGGGQLGPCQLAVGSGGCEME